MGLGRKRGSNERSPYRRARLACLRRGDRRLHWSDRARRVDAARAAVLRRGRASGGSFDRVLDGCPVDHDLHHRLGALRDPGCLLRRGSGSAKHRRRFCCLVRPARGDSLCVRLHDGGEGRYRYCRRARCNAHQRRDRRAGSDGNRFDGFPLRHTLAGGLDGAAVHVHRRNRDGLPGLLHRGRQAGGSGYFGRLPADLLAVPEPGGLPLQRDQGDVDGHSCRAGVLLLRLHGLGWAGGGGKGDGQVDGAQPGARHDDRDARHEVFWGTSPRTPIGG